MMYYSVQPKEKIFVNGYGFLYFAKNMSNSIGRNTVYPLSEKLSVEYSQKPLEQSATDTLKSASKRAIQNIVETTGDLIGNKIAGKISKVSKTSLHNNL